MFRGKWSSRSAMVEVAAATMMALSVMLSGCATAPQPVKETKMVWPPPPLPARIQFVRNITSEKDLTNDSTFTDSLAAFLTGEKIPSGRIAEPSGLAVSDDGNRLYVADMMQQAVFMFDFKTQKFTQLGDVGVASGVALDAKENLYVVDMGRKTDRRLRARRQAAERILRPRARSPERHRDRQGAGQDLRRRHRIARGEGTERQGLRPQGPAHRRDRRGARRRTSASSAIRPT